MNESMRPDPEQPDAAFDRLRSADPAVGLEPDQTSLDATVRARLAEPEEAAGGTLAGPAQPGDELAAARTRRGRGSWLAVAAVAAGALVFSSAGYAIGQARGGGSATAGGVITLGEQPAAQNDAQGSASLLAPEQATAAGDSARSSLSLPYGYYGGRTVFTSSGLPGDAGSADAWGYDPAAAFTADSANRIAAALGLAGEATLVDGAWTVGPNDGSGPSLQLQPDGLASVNFYDPSLDPYSCQAVEPQTSDGSESSSGSAGSAGSSGSAGSTDSVAPDDSGAEPLPKLLPDPVPSCTGAPLSDAPQGDAAVAAARDLLSSFGLDPAAFEFETQDSGLAQLSYVNAFQVIGGERTGAMWNLGLVGDGVQSLNGPLAPAISLGSYDVISAQDAVARLSDPRFGASYGGPLMYAADQGVAEAPVTTLQEGNAAPGRTVPPTAQPGTTFAWPVTEVTLTSARLGLSMTTLPDGATVLLPAYALSSADGQSWSVIAVADAQLDFAPVG